MGSNEEIRSPPPPSSNEGIRRGSNEGVRGSNEGFLWGF